MFVEKKRLLMFICLTVLLSLISTIATVSAVNIGQPVGYEIINGVNITIHNVTISNHKSVTKIRQERISKGERTRPVQQPPPRATVFGVLKDLATPSESSQSGKLGVWLSARHTDEQVVRDIGSEEDAEISNKPIPDVAPNRNAPYAKRQAPQLGVLGSYKPSSVFGTGYGLACGQPSLQDCNVLLTAFAYRATTSPGSLMFDRIQENVPYVRAYQSCAVLVTVEGSATPHIYPLDVATALTMQLYRSLVPFGLGGSTAGDRGGVVDYYVVEQGGAGDFDTCAQQAADSDSYQTRTIAKIGLSPKLISGSSKKRGPTGTVVTNNACGVTVSEDCYDTIRQVLLRIGDNYRNVDAVVVKIPPKRVSGIDGGRCRASIANNSQTTELPANFLDLLSDIVTIAPSNVQEGRGGRVSETRGCCGRAVLDGGRIGQVNYDVCAATSGIIGV